MQKNLSLVDLITSQVPPRPPHDRGRGGCRIIHIPNPKSFGGGRCTICPPRTRHSSLGPFDIRTPKSSPYSLPFLPSCHPHSIHTSGLCTQRRTVGEVRRGGEAGFDIRSPHHITSHRIASHPLQALALSFFLDFLVPVWLIGDGEDPSLRVCFRLGVGASFHAVHCHKSPSGRPIWQPLVSECETIN